MRPTKARLDDELERLRRVGEGDRAAQFRAGGLKPSATPVVDRRHRFVGAYLAADLGVKHDAHAVVNGVALFRPAAAEQAGRLTDGAGVEGGNLSLIHISEPTRRTPISYAVFCL